jgi:hypothetical protein
LACWCLAGEELHDAIFVAVEARPASVDRWNGVRVQPEVDCPDKRRGVLALGDLGGLEHTEDSCGRALEDLHALLWRPVALQACGNLGVDLALMGQPTQTTLGESARGPVGNLSAR